MATDIAIDPATHAFIETSGGDWLETEDSRTAVLMQLDCRKGEWWGDPEAGSYLAAMMEDGGPDAEPTEIEDIRNEAMRALQVLVNAGVISDLRVAILESDAANGRAALLLAWVDRGSGRPLDLVYPSL